MRVSRVGGVSRCLSCMGKTTSSRLAAFEEDTSMMLGAGESLRYSLSLVDSVEHPPWTRFFVATMLSPEIGTAEAVMRAKLKPSPLFGKQPWSRTSIGRRASRPVINGPRTWGQARASDEADMRRVRSHDSGPLHRCCLLTVSSGRELVQACHPDICS